MLTSRDIQEAWWLNLKLLSGHGYWTDVQRGSFANTERRLQLKALAGIIYYPLPIILPAPKQGIPAPATIEYVHKYFRDKLIGDVKSENEEYTYGERISEQLPKIIEMLQKTPETNQAVIEVGLPTDIDLPDPPCLRCITLKVIQGKLHLGCYFRSWDLWSGFPSNVGALALLQQLICGFLEKVELGPVFYASDGAHVYEYAYEYMQGVLK